jgi:hypothetical protein
MDLTQHLRRHSGRNRRYAGLPHQRCVDADTRTYVNGHANRQRRCRTPTNTPTGVADGDEHWTGVADLTPPTVVAVVVAA